MSKTVIGNFCRGKWNFFRRRLGGPRTETTVQKWSASLKRLRTADLSDMSGSDISHYVN